MRERQTIINLIERIIRSWLEEDYDFLKSCFDENVVMCLSPSASPSKGPEAVCDALRRLHAGRIVKQYDQAEFTVNRAGNCTVAFYHYHMEYDEKDAHCSESGIDFFVFEYRENEWWLRWRSVYATEHP